MLLSLQKQVVFLNWILLSLKFYNFGINLRQKMFLTHRIQTCQRLISQSLLRPFWQNTFLKVWAFTWMLAGWVSWWVDGGNVEGTILLEDRLTHFLPHMIYHPTGRRSCSLAYKGKITEKLCVEFKYLLKCHRNHDLFRWNPLLMTAFIENV